MDPSDLSDWGGIHRAPLLEVAYLRDYLFIETDVFLRETFKPDNISCRKSDDDVHVIVCTCIGIDIMARRVCFCEE